MRIFSSTFNLFTMAFLSLCFTSCVEVVGNEEVEEINGMLIDLKKADSTVGIFNNENYSDLLAWEQGIDSSIQIIDFNLSYKLGEMIFKFSDLKRYLKTFLSIRKPMGTNVSRLADNLTLLRNDIQNGSGQRSRYDSQIANERKKFNEVLIQVRHLEDIHKEIFLIFNELKMQLPEQLKLEIDANAL